MKINTDLFYVGGAKQPTFGKKHLFPIEALWQLWFTQEFDGLYMPLVMSWEFPVKPTRKQVRKLRRSFRKMDGFCQ